MLFDGDLDNSNADDTDNMLKFTDGRTLASATTLKLQTASGSIQCEGALGLQATAGVHVMVDVSTTQAGKELVVNADTDKSGDGVFTLAAGKAINSNNGEVRVVWRSS